MSLVLAAPALPLHTAGKYVAGAYVVFVALLLVYLAIMARRVNRTERELAQRRDEVQARQAADDLHDREAEPVA